jgi:ABC-2 type transport system permease protein
MKNIINLSVMQAWRSMHLQVFILILLGTFIISGINNVLVLKAREKQFEDARQQVRQAWLNQGPQNPHSSAHYGHYVFKPAKTVQMLDNGINSFAGSLLRLEAHAQHEPAFSPAENRTESSRFGDLGFSWIMQVLMPLFIILLCFNSASSDRENQNLRLIVSQGMSRSRYIWGKILGNLLIISVVAIIGMLLQLLIYGVLGSSKIQMEEWNFMLSWIGTYLLYYFILSTLSVITGALVNSSKSSLILQVSVWVLAIVIMPKITANIGSRIYPLEQKSSFNKALREDRQKGIDGHNPEDKRLKAFEDSLLKKYAVDSLNALPVNADGLLMQADEEYANIVYDKHFARVRETINRQNSIGRMASFINPFLAIRNISMGLTSSDYYQQLSFVREAELYRRYLIHELNTKMAYGGSKTGDWEWKTDPAYWTTVKDFEYPNETLRNVISRYKLEFTSLFLWVILSLLLVKYASQKMKIL